MPSCHCVRACVLAAERHRVLASALGQGRPLSCQLRSGTRFQTRSSHHRQQLVAEAGSLSDSYNTARSLFTLHCPTRVHPIRHRLHPSRHLRPLVLSLLATSSIRPSAMARSCIAIFLLGCMALACVSRWAIFTTARGRPAAGQVAGGPSPDADDLWDDPWVTDHPAWAWAWPTHPHPDAGSLPALSAVVNTACRPSSHSGARRHLPCSSQHHYMSSPPLPLHPRLPTFSWRARATRHAFP